MATRAKSPTNGKLVLVQTMVPTSLKAQIAEYARELDPHRRRPNESLALRMIAAEWAARRS